MMSRCCCTMRGPGTLPQARGAPMIGAAGALPGTLNSSVGTRPPASTALFAASGAMMPRMSPLPNRERSLLVATTCPSALHVPAVAPVAGGSPLPDRGTALARGGLVPMARPRPGSAPEGGGPPRPHADERAPEDEPAVLDDIANSLHPAMPQIHAFGDGATAGQDPDDFGDAPRARLLSEQASGK